VALSLDNSQLYTQLRSELAERRQIEEVLRISQENYSSYFNMGTVGICVTAPDKSWIDVNDRLCEMLGYSKDELTHLTWSAMTHPDDLNADLELFEQLIRGERDSYQLDKRFIRKDGGVLHTSMYVSCQRYPNRSARYVLASLVDITERVQKEEALKQAQAEVLTQQRIMATYEERQRLGRNLHDSVNQSIHSLVLFADTLNSVLEKGNLKRSVEISEHLRESARQALKETRLLLYQIQPSNENNEVNLLRDLEKRLSTVEQRAGLQASVILEGTEEDCPEAWRENLFWIAIEALNNSLKHAQARSVMVYLRCFPEYVEMEISDDGIGFKSSRIRAGGMGLGNMHDRARQIGGTLSFISEPGKGTRVIVLAEIKKARSDQD
jgi:PAS domain S-box-containing protein